MKLIFIFNQYISSESENYEEDSLSDSTANLLFLGAGLLPLGSD